MHTSQYYIPETGWKIGTAIIMNTVSVHTYIKLTPSHPRHLCTSAFVMGYRVKVDNGSPSGVVVREPPSRVIPEVEGAVVVVVVVPPCPPELSAKLAPWFGFGWL